MPATAELPAVKHLDPPAVNGLFPVLVPEVIQPLRDWSFFWDWDLARDQVRWMTAWDTSQRTSRRSRQGSARRWRPSTPSRDEWHTRVGSAVLTRRSGCS